MERVLGHGKVGDEKCVHPGNRETLVVSVWLRFGWESAFLPCRLLMGYGRCFRKSRR